jgi:hypothetical protein
VVGRHVVPVPRARRRTPWYVLGLPLIPLGIIVFVLAGWWDRYKLVPITVGFAFVTLSLWLQYTRDRLDNINRNH